jgi:hypothetical protein
VQAQDAIRKSEMARLGEDRSIVGTDDAAWQLIQNMPAITSMTREGTIQL